MSLALGAQARRGVFRALALSLATLTDVSRQISGEVVLLFRRSIVGEIEHRLAKES